MGNYVNDGRTQNFIIKLGNMGLIHPVVDHVCEVWKKDPDKAIVGISS
jgi:hypothetical protein